MNYKEIGSIIRPLPFDLRFLDFDLRNLGLKQFADEDKFFLKLNTKTVSVTSKTIAKSSTKGKHKTLTYNTLNGFFRQLKKAINLPGSKLVIAYWPDLDKIGHHFGINSK